MLGQVTKTSNMAASLLRNWGHSGISTNEIQHWHNTQVF